MMSPTEFAPFFKASSASSKNQSTLSTSFKFGECSPNHSLKDDDPTPVTGVYGDRSKQTQNKTAAGGEVVF